MLTRYLFEEVLNVGVVKGVTVAQGGVDMTAPNIAFLKAVSKLCEEKDTF